MTAAYVALAGVMGLMIGSFLNVVIARLPVGESLAKPASRCPKCETPIKPYDNIPVVSWLLLRGRCRACGEQISARYPLVELATAVLYVAVVLVKGADRDAWLGLVLVTLLVPIALIDFDRRIIPNRIVLPGAIAGIAIVAATDSGALVQHLIAGAAAFLFLFVAALAYPRGMGMGDVKLAGMLGLYLGSAVAPAMLASFLSGSVVGGVIIARKGAAEGRKTAVPFGPFLALGALVGLFVGPDIVDWYRDTYL
jgi:leader peptidase (prepilin peptidase)/N-methyltransferase